MAIAYKSAGAGVVTEASGGALTPLCPATVDAGDILIAHCAYEGTTTTPSTPSGWELLGGPYTVETAYRHWIFGKVAAGTEDGAGGCAFGTPAVTTLRVARIYSFSGRVAGTILELVPAASFAHLSHATDPQMPTVTTTITGALAVACTFQADDNAQAPATGESGGDWVEVSDGHEYIQAATTPDTCLHLQFCIPTADPGTVTGGTVATVNDPCGVIGFQIKPSNPQSLTPTTLALTTTKFAPTVTVSNNQRVTPTTLAIVTSAFAPTVTVGNRLTPSTASLTISTFAPTVTATAHQSVTPTTKALVLATFAPTVLTPVSVTTTTKALSLSTFAPTVTVSDNKSVTPSTKALTITTYEPTVSVDVVDNSVSVTPSTLSLVLQAYAPTVTTTERELRRSFAGGGSLVGRVDAKSLHKIKQRDEGPRAKLIAKIKTQTERDMRDMAGF